MGCIKTLLEPDWEQFKSIVRANLSQLSMLSWEQFKSIIQANLSQLSLLSREQLKLIEVNYVWQANTSQNPPLAAQQPLLAQEMSVYTPRWPLKRRHDGL